MKKNDNRLGSAIRTLRTDLGLTQADAARAFCVTRPAYTYKENGKTAYTIDDLLRLGKLFSVPPELFFHPELLERADAREEFARNYSQCVQHLPNKLR